MLQTELLLRNPIHVSLMRPYWYDSDEENMGSEYDSDDETIESPRSVTWTNDVALGEIQEYLEMKLINCKELEEQEMVVLGTWFILNEQIIMSLKLDIKAFLQVGTLYTKYFGYIHDTWEEDRPYDILKVQRVNADGFIEYRAIIKTYWLRLIQRHWRNRAVSNGGNQRLCGLLSCYSKLK